MPNAKLAYRVLDHIDAHPEQWNQENWLTRPIGDDCGTAACFAGWACLLSGDQPQWWEKGNPVTAHVAKLGDDHQSRSVRYRAAELLDVNYDEAEQLFDASNDREDLGTHVEGIFGPRPTP